MYSKSRTIANILSVRLLSLSFWAIN